MRDRRFSFTPCIMALVGMLITLLAACGLPQVSAEQRLFLDVSVDFLGEYRLPKQEVQGTTVGGLSGITYDRQRDRVYAISDDQTTPRFYTLKLSLDTPTPNQVGIKRVDVEDVTLIKGQDGEPYPAGIVDLEGIALSPTRTLFISSEGIAHKGISPSVSEVDPATGQWIRNLPIPNHYLPQSDANQQPQGVRDNVGFEALTLIPGGGMAIAEPFRVFVATESFLAQDRTPPPQPSPAPAPDETQPTQTARLLHYLIEGNKSLLVSEHAYPLEPPPKRAIASGLVELLAIDQGGHFLSLERSLGLTTGFGIKLFQVTLAGATDTAMIDSLKGTLPGIQPARKRLVLDLSQLDSALDNLEGMTLGPRLPDGSQSLVLVSDDNFQMFQSNLFLLFRIRGLPAN